MNDWLAIFGGQVKHSFSLYFCVEMALGCPRVIGRLIISDRAASRQSTSRRGFTALPSRITAPCGYGQIDVCHKRFLRAFRVGFFLGDP
jgi:hypothetical protein